MLLSQEKITTEAPAKAILIGEHAAVYGHPAVAMALPDIRLILELDPTAHHTSSWDESWSVSIQGEESVLSAKTKHMLTQTLQCALLECGFTQKLTDFTPQKIAINSQIPLGGGLGGSAAISLALLRLAQKVTKKELSSADIAKSANKLDSLFHGGKASGLDTAAVASSGIIEFKKDHPPVPLKNKTSFWIALVDSGERAETSQMISLVAEHLKNSPEKTGNHLSSLGKLALMAKSHLEQGALSLLAQVIDEAQEHLRGLCVSTPAIENIIQTLKKQGALGAKVTGAGGGGLVLAIFSQNPSALISIFPGQKIFISKVNAA